MQKYNILELNEKLLPELQSIAEELGIKKVSSLKKEELVYRILDEQAISYAGIQAEKEKEKEASKPQEDKTAKVRLNEKRRMSFKEKREFEQLEQEIATLEEEKKTIEAALCSGTLSVEELTEKSKRLPEITDLIDEKTMRWLELSEIED